jgi:hypothetical protein
MPPINVVPTAINAKIKPTSQCEKFTATRHAAGNADAETNLIICIQFCSWLNKYIITLNLENKKKNHLLHPKNTQDMNMGLHGKTLATYCPSYGSAQMYSLQQYLMKKYKINLYITIGYFDISPAVSLHGRK